MVHKRGTILITNLFDSQYCKDITAEQHGNDDVFIEVIEALHYSYQCKRAICRWLNDGGADLQTDEVLKR